MSINRVMISGNLTRDGELQTVSGGLKVLRLGVAVNDRFYNKKSEQWEDSPNFVDCVMFGARAETLAKYLTKGCKVAIDGSLRYSAWESDGQKRSKIEIVINEIEFMSNGKKVSSDARADVPPYYN